MYAIRVHREFCAAHSIRVGGHAESIHGHNWRVDVELSGAKLDEDGLLCDFHTLEATLDDIVGRFHNRNLNEVEPFTHVNPTAELIARHIADTLTVRLVGELARETRVAWVSVSEAPGCVALYRTS